MCHTLFRQLLWTDVFFFRVNQNGDSVRQVETGMALCRIKGRQGRTRSFFFPICLTTSTFVSISFARGPFMSSQQRWVLQQRDKIREEGAEKDRAAVIHLPASTHSHVSLSLPFKMFKNLKMCPQVWLEINLLQFSCSLIRQSSKFCFLVFYFFNVENVLSGPAAGTRPPGNRWCEQGLSHLSCWSFAYSSTVIRGVSVTSLTCHLFVLLRITKVTE